MPLAAGRRLHNYEILRLLGSGGMGEVWLAKDLQLGRHVALKLLLSPLTSDPVRVKRFEQEARSASLLNHPNVCTVYGLGVNEDGEHFISMEHVEGQTLRERLTRGALRRNELLDIAIQIASALTAAAGAGVVHRDLKPDNVMVRPDGLVKVLDFGVAKLVSPDTDPTLTLETRVHSEPGKAVGTISYMSPEQARGREVDARTDVWALGVLLYEMVAGRRPFAGQSTSDVVASILEHEPAPLARFDPDIAPELQRIVAKALRKDPEQRYQVMKDLLLDLQAFRNESGESAATYARKPGSRRNLILAALAGVLVFGLAAVGFWIRKSAAPAAPVTHPGVNRPLTRLTFDSGLQREATFSPDGRSIAYASDRAGNFDIWVQSIGSGAARQLTTSRSQETQPAWSPDGQLIVFRSERNGGGLFSVPVSGGAERQLSTFGTNPQWVRDGSEILFRAGGTTANPWGLYAVSPDGGDPPRELLHAFLAGGLWPWIAPHPDGRISALGLHRKLGSGFFTVSRDGRAVTQSQNGRDFPLELHSYGTRLARFQWNGDATKLFVEASVNEVRNLWRVEVNPTTLEWLSAERLTTGTGADTAAAVSHDGTRLAFTAERELIRAWSFPFDDKTGRVMGSSKPITGEDGRVSNHALSPDGRTLAYNHARAGSTSRARLWITDIDSGKSEMLSEDASWPAWSRDGRRIAYTVFRQPSNQNGRVLDAARADLLYFGLAARDIGGPERIVGKWSNQAIASPWDWTTDGRGILCSYSSPPETGLARLVLWPSSAEGGDPALQVVFDNPRGGLWQAKFSPNQRWVAFVSVEKVDPNRTQLYVARANGPPPSEWLQIAADHVWADKPRWASDGRMLYFLSRHDSEFFNLWGVRFDSDRGQPIGAPFAITSFDSPGFMISTNMGEDSELGVAAHRVVLTMMSGTGNIWMLENVDR